ncbi:DUF6544 family protein [Actinoplanes friuliensis]|uniref:Uncharacterized protein n=1 Tax=Actinoplanes friuliensis DSM 7358 TaxID=1246995 RepID=U5W3X9_9ACTN|nr:DUF6544 family protein [Actinoplanes friuliensis]AGZ43839.1 hypothetical protein AFR_27890 [Actinoplanes friuliensis DSM 7358]
MAYPRGLTDDVRTDWGDLGEATGKPAVFGEGDLSALPEPVRRWLTHSIAPETPLLTAVEVTTHGTVRDSAWRDFSATQRLSPARGFVWAANGTMAGMPVTGFDRYTRLTGQKRWRLLSRVPVRTADGPDLTRSSAARLAGDLLIVAPAAALSSRVKWQPLDADRAVARIRVDAGYHEVTLTVAADGSLTSMSMPRWGADTRGSFSERVFGADLTDETTFEGFTIPGTVVAGWDHGTAAWADGQFLRYTVDAAHYR